MPCATRSPSRITGVIARLRRWTTGSRARSFVLGSVLASVVCLVVGAGTASATAPAGGAAQHVYRFGVVGSNGKIAATERRRPTVVQGIEGTVVEIATSNSDGYALTSAGTVWAWGAGAAGELGDGTTPRDVSHAVQVDFPGGVRIASLANPMPFDAALAVDSTGQPWGWGLDASGDLCGSNSVEPLPVRIPLAHVTSATGARTHALFDSTGHLYACGSGEGGALGTGSTADVSVPTPVQGLPGTQRITMLTSSWEGSGALLADGAYYDWGYNAAGQLGDGTTTDSNLPVRVDLPSPVRQVFQGGSGAGNGQTIAQLSDGSVWAWGDNGRGQLGDGTRTSADVPVRVDVPAGVAFAKVASGGYASYAIDRSGRLWAWGGNENGQLGTVATRDQTRPVDVGVTLTQISSTASNVAGFERSR